MLLEVGSGILKATPSGSSDRSCSIVALSEIVFAFKTHRDDRKEEVFDERIPL